MTKEVKGLNKIKKRMKAWRDVYGGDIFYDIDGAKTKKELADIMDMYHHHLEDSANEAQRDCENFKKELGLQWAN